MKPFLHTAMALALGALLAPAAMAQSTDSPAVLKAQQLRQEIQEKQKALAQQSRNDSAAPVATPAAPLELTIDETDSPGATK